MNVTIEIADVEISDEDIKKMMKKFGVDLEYNIKYIGRYAKYREFGSPPIDISKLSLKITKEFIDTGMPEQKAREAAMQWIESMKVEGMKPTPFLRPAISMYKYRMTTLNIKNKKEIEDVMRNIAKAAEENYKRQSGVIMIEIPLKYTITVTREGRKVGDIDTKRKV